MLSTRSFSLFLSRRPFDFAGELVGHYRKEHTYAIYMFLPKCRYTGSKRSLKRNSATNRQWLEDKVANAPNV